MLWDVKNVLFVLHVNSNELVADFWSMLCVVYGAEKLSLDILLKLHVALKLDALTFDLLAPAVLVEALSEEDDVCQDDLVVIPVYPVGHSVEI